MCLEYKFLVKPIKFSLLSRLFGKCREGEKIFLNVNASACLLKSRHCCFLRQCKIRSSMKTFQCFRSSHPLNQLTLFLITVSFVTQGIPSMKKISPSTVSPWLNFSQCHCISWFSASIDTHVMMSSEKLSVHLQPSNCIKLKISKSHWAVKFNPEVWRWQVQLFKETKSFFLQLFSFFLIPQTDKVTRTWRTAHFFMLATSCWQTDCCFIES